MLSGEGAAAHGGRWNSRGVPAVYCCESLSLCALEILVHLPRGVLRLYSFVELEIPDEQVTHLSDDLPADPEATASMGDGLLGPDGVLAFSVPSAVNPLECIVVINPAHPDFDVVSCGEIRPFPMDERLLVR